MLLTVGFLLLLLLFLSVGFGVGAAEIVGTRSPLLRGDGARVGDEATKVCLVPFEWVPIYSFSKYSALLP